MTRRDYRDLAIAELAAAEAELLDRIEDLARERDAYRELLCGSLAALHEAVLRERRHRESYGRLLDELRELRALQRGGAQARGWIPIPSSSDAPRVDRAC